MRLSELARQIENRLAVLGDVDVGVSPETCGFEGESFEVMVIDEYPPEYRSNIPEAPYWLYFRKKR